MKEIIYSRAAIKVLRKIPANTRSRIRGKIAEYAADPASQGNNVKTLQGLGTIRLRIGDWRVVMLDGAVLDVINIGLRGGIYD